MLDVNKLSSLYHLPSMTLDDVAYWFKLHLMLEEIDPENAINPHAFWKHYHMLYQ